jgi:hypothetical protein
MKNNSGPFAQHIDISMNEIKYSSFVERLTLQVKNSRKLRMKVFNRKIKISKIIKSLQNE